MTNIQIPPGLFGEDVEVFSRNGEAMALHQGSVKSFFELPQEIIDVFRDDLQQNAAATMALELAGYDDPDDKLLKYCICRFGGFDQSPDFAGGTLNSSEHYECGHRGSCSMEGIVCGTLILNGRAITPFEIRMMKLLATEDTLPVVAGLLEVSMTTFELRKKLLFEKLGVMTRAGMVAAAYDCQILKPAVCST